MELTLPILPENRARYPKDWKRIAAEIRKRAGNRCEFEWGGKRCEARQGRPHPRIFRRAVLTVVHLDHTPENCDPSNLRAACQQCAWRWRLARERRACPDLFDELILICACARCGSTPEDYGVGDLRRIEGKWRCDGCARYCIGCDKNTVQSGEYYMVKDELWRAAGMGDGMLCLKCLEKRIGRELTLADFTAMPPAAWSQHVARRLTSPKARAAYFAAACKVHASIRAALRRRRCDDVCCEFVEDVCYEFVVAAIEQLAGEGKPYAAPAIAALLGGPYDVAVIERELEQLKNLGWHAPA